MTKILAGAAPLAGALVAAATAAQAATMVLTVGPAGQYQTIASAVGAANADTNLANQYIITVAPGTYTNDTATINRPLAIVAAVPGSAVILNETAALPNQKGILLAYAPLTVDGLTFENAQIANSLGGNGAGIRSQDTSNYGTLTVRNSTFINNQMGILTSNNANSFVVLTNNLFMNNGNPNPSYFGHAAYIGQASTLVAIGNEICGTNIGHDIKSRTAVSVIENNSLYDGTADPNQPSCNIGSSSYALDIPNGGQAIVIGNIMVQGPASPNLNMVAYGEEGMIFPINSITFSNNMMQNTASSGTAIYDNPSAPVPVQGSNNSFSSSLTQIYPASANQLTGTVGAAGPISPDGTISNAPSGPALTTAAGTWTWGAAYTGQYAATCGKCYQVNLNGANVSNAVEMEVANGGNLYVLNGYGWFVWSNGTFVKSQTP